VSDPLPPSAAVPLYKGDNKTSNKAILPLKEGESRRRRQGVAHTPCIAATRRLPYTTFHCVHYKAVLLARMLGL
jgi:hypothetical protein